MIIDAADAAEIGKFNWSAAKEPTGIYAVRQAGRNPARTVLMHRVIAERAGMDVSREVDHRDGNTTDNRRRNLRPASKGQQRCNQGIGARNTSGFKGVSKHGKSWRVQVQLGDRTFSRGGFATAEEAAEVARQMRMELHGEFANHGTAGLH